TLSAVHIQFARAVQKTAKKLNMQSSKKLKMVTQYIVEGYNENRLFRVYFYSLRKELIQTRSNLESPFVSDRSL
ncbi:MAG: hypothetical protein ACK45T_17855, partial [Pseudanabaena sp.]